MQGPRGQGTFVTYQLLLFAMRRYPIARALSALTGLFMLFIGLRFLLAPRAGAEGFGVLLPAEATTYAFHYAKGIRDVFSGALLLVFATLGYNRPLAWVLLLGALIPCVDAAIVLAQPGAALMLAMPHFVAIGLLLGLAWSLFRSPAASPSLA